MSKPETTHTPGPWGIERTDDTNWIGPLRPDGKVAAIVADTDREGLRADVLAQNDANAHLIAAAPELYKALKELIETLRAEAPGTTLNNHRFDALGIKANNALLKAEGRR